MPYTSPYGVTTTKPPPKKLPQSKASQARSAASSPRLTPSSNSTSTTSSYFSTAPSSQSNYTDELIHIPSKELGEVSSRDRDAYVVESLEHWKGWNARRESENEVEDLDPLEVPPQVVEIGKGSAEDVVVAVREINVGT
jgi:hypothetical protein